MKKIIRGLSMLSLGLALTSGGLAQGSRAEALRIYVATGGATSGADVGTKARPAGSLAAAQTLVRAAIKKSGGARQRIEVVIAPGEYTLEATLALTPEDSGAPGAPVVWMAEEPGSVTISGGTPLTAGGGSDGMVTLRAPGLNPAQWAGAGQLYVNSQRATLARQPNQNDYWFVKAALPQPGESDKDRGSQAFRPWGKAADWIRSMSADDKSRAVVHVMQSWTSGLHRLDGPQPEDGVRVKPKSIWPFMSKGLNQRFYVENVAKAFDAPGEWIGVGNEVRYRPRAGEAGKPMEAVLARLEKLVTITGESGGRSVDSVEFRGLRFMHALYVVPPEGYQDNQAAQAMGAAIEVDGARNIVFDQCVVAHTGAYGLWFRSAVRDSRVSDSEFRDLGAGGVRIGLTKQPPGDSQATGGIKINDNRIVGTGRVMPGAVAVWIGQSFDNEVSHNAISNTTYTGISVGWSWGYAPASSGRNKIVGNLLFDIGRGMLADGAAIYTLGVSPGTEIIGNVIREVRGYEGYGYGAFGLYNDQGSSGITMKNNIVVGTDTGGYYLHFGRDLVLKQNLFALGRMSEIRVSKPDELTNLDISENVLIPLGSEPLDGKFPPGSVQLLDNSVSDRASKGGRLNIKLCGSGCKPAATSVSLGDGAKDLRFSGLDPATSAWVGKVLAQVGPDGDAPRMRGKAQLVLEAGPPKPVAPAVPLEIDLNAATTGLPASLRYAPANDPNAFKVVNDGGASGGRCLLFADNASFASRSEPNAYAFLNHERGTSVARFAIRYDANASFVHEWRDDGRPFAVGPSLTIDAAGVKAAGRVIAKPHPGDWVEITVSAPLASEDGRWTLEVRSQGKVLGRAADLKFGTLGWQHLNWVGFISNAATDSQSCLAGIHITNDGGGQRASSLQ